MQPKQVTSLVEKYRVQERDEKMHKGLTLKENIQQLIKLYKEELEEEEQKDIDEQNLERQEGYKNIIIELEYALEVSKEV